MLTTIRQVNEEFFRKFYGLKMLIGGAEKTVLCRYAKKSSYDYVEEQSNQVYPCIAIQDYIPTPKKEWYIDMHAYFGGKSLDGLTGYLYQRPIWMEFRYDVSIASKSYNDFIAMQDYFMENFVYGKRFIFNEQLSGEDTIGDIVPYEIRETDIPRTDGVFEVNYEFTCSVWLYPQKPEEVDIVQKIVLRGTPIALGDTGKGLLESINVETNEVMQSFPNAKLYSRINGGLSDGVEQLLYAPSGGNKYLNLSTNDTMEIVGSDDSDNSTVDWRFSVKKVPNQLFINEKTFDGSEELEIEVADTPLTPQEILNILSEENNGNGN